MLKRLGQLGPIPICSAWAAMAEKRNSTAAQKVPSPIANMMKTAMLHITPKKPRESWTSARGPIFASRSQFVAPHKWGAFGVTVIGLHVTSIADVATTDRGVRMDHTQGILGEALYAGLSQATLWGLLVQKGVVSREEAHEALDAALIFVEQSLLRNEPSAVAIGHVRARLESLLRNIGRPERTTAD